MKSFALGGGNPPISDKLLMKLLPQMDRPLQIVLLTVSREGWESYIQDKYIIPFKKLVKCQFEIVLGDKEDDPSIIRSIETAELLIIGGGETFSYHQIYCKEKIKMEILKAYNSGIPIIGMSAGAIIMGEQLAISPKDNPTDSLIIGSEIGIYDDFFIGVHFSKWNDGENLMKAKEKIADKKTFGIDDDSYIVFNENKGYTFLDTIHSV